MRRPDGQGLCAPKNAPAEIIGKLNKDINIALARSEIKAQLAEMQASPLGGTPGDFGKLIERELKK
jgi:tripartite-type tricarboxylate transporter receptor subunit TctC